VFKVLLEKIASKLNQAEIPYMIIGGQAIASLFIHIAENLPDWIMQSE